MSKHTQPGAEPHPRFEEQELSRQEWLALIALPAFGWATLVVSGDAADIGCLLNEPPASPLMLSLIGVTAIGASAYLRFPLLICAATGIIWACLGHAVAILLGVFHKVLIGLGFAFIVLLHAVSSQDRTALMSAILLIVLAGLAGWIWWVGFRRASLLTRAMLDSRSAPAVIAFMGVGAALAIYGINNAPDILTWSPACTKD